MDSSAYRKFLYSLRDCDSRQLASQQLRKFETTRLGTAPRDWSTAAGVMASAKLLWMAIPLELLDPRTVDLAPIIHDVASQLFEAPTPEDLAAVRAILKRLRRYIVFGRPASVRSNREFLRLLREQNGRCRVCGYLFQPADIEAHNYVDEFSADAQIGDLRPPHIDHVIPIFLGGDDEKNLQILCSWCNLAKGPTISWATHRALSVTFKPSDLFNASAGERVVVLLRDGSCTACGLPPLELEGPNELLVARRDGRRGWIVENMLTACRRCCSLQGLSPWVRRTAPAG